MLKLQQNIRPPSTDQDYYLTLLMRVNRYNMNFIST